MILNKKKCGIIKISGIATLSVKEKKEEGITDIPYVESYKYLGVTFDKKLSP